MTPLPKKKHTKSRSGKRLNSPSNKKGLPQVLKCPSCGKLKAPHKACPSCGFYK